MKKMIWMLVALLPLSVMAGPAKWIHGHGTDLHHELSQDSTDEGSRDTASATTHDQNYDSDQQVDDRDLRDATFDRGAFTGTDYTNEAPSKADPDGDRDD